MIQSANLIIARKVIKSPKIFEFLSDTIDKISLLSVKKYISSLRDFINNSKILATNILFLTGQPL